MRVKITPMIETRSIDGITVLTLNHGKVSALDLELLEELTSQLESSRGPSTAAVVLTGTGSSFSAGVDLLRLLNDGAPYLEKFYPALIKAFTTLYMFPKPVVAAINGHAIAGGCVLVQCCDARFMAEGRARIGVPELLVGVPFPILVLEIMRAAINPSHANELLLGGATLTPPDAIRCGLIDRIVEPANLLELAIEEARRLASISPAVYVMTKRELRREVLERAEASNELESEVERLWLDEETNIRIRDYLDRTIGRHS